MVDITVQEPGATDSAGATTDASRSTPIESLINAPNAIDNPLSVFATYNYIFTLSALTPGEINDPDNTYHKKAPTVVIMRSGGGLKEKTQLPFDPYGRVEYFIDNLEVDTIIVPNIKTRQTNATAIRFQIIEPYSMGLFLQTLQLAAAEAGFQNYLEAAYLLTIDFKGWNDDGDPVPAEKVRRYIPIKIAKADLRVNESGSVYDVEAYPWNELSLVDQVQRSTMDVKLEGSKLIDICQKGVFSIANAFNNREMDKLINGEVLVSDQYIILFPQETDGPVSSKYFNEASGSARPIDELWVSSRGTTGEDGAIDAKFSSEVQRASKGSEFSLPALGENVKNLAEDETQANTIGNATLVNDYLSGKKQPFGRPLFSEIESSPGSFERGKIQISENGNVITFRAGITIQEMIEELVILSSYGTQIADFAASVDGNGMIPWFKIETHVYISPNISQESLSGRHPRIYVFCVVPFKAHISKYAPATDSYPGYKGILGEIVKQYDYLYTGKNDDIIDFNIEFDKAFYTAITGFGGKYKSKFKTANSDRMHSEQPEEDFSINVGDGSGTDGNVSEYSMETGTGKHGTSLSEDYKTTIARDFNEALINSPADLVLGNLTIWGDPYYIADSGFGNYAAKEGITININADGSMDHLRSETDILLNFRTPIDFNDETGFVDYATLKNTRLGSFSGIYKVIMVTSTFKDGIFSQELKLTRRPNQSSSSESAARAAIEFTFGSIAANDTEYGGGAYFDPSAVG